MKRIICRIERCLGCKSCELACAVAHSVSGRLPASLHEPAAPRPRIRVELMDARGALMRQRTLALQCRHCADPACVQACIAGALSTVEPSGEVRIDPARCVGCWSCIMVCPFGAVARDEGIHRAMKCDHCPGRAAPACVEACPTEALAWIGPEEAGAAAP